MNAIGRTGCYLGHRLDEKRLAAIFSATVATIILGYLFFMGLFTAVYLVMGGYKSMTMIDVFFGVIMLAGVSILVVSVISRGSGLANIAQGLDTIDPKLTGVVGPPGWWGLFCLVFLTSVAPFAMPQLVQKFYAIRDNRSIKIGMVACSTKVLIISRSPDLQNN